MKYVPLYVRTPGRYLGGEVNLPRKRLEPEMLRMALAFADVYEVGMSHIGLKILYEILNRQPDVYCERVFAPWPDMKRYLESQGRLLTTLETGTPLNRLEVVGFSLQYEMSYPTLLTMLRMGGIPPRARDRKRGDPWIIAGGPCATNPEPLAAFIDAFVIGDGERAVLEIADCLKRAREEGADRSEALKALSEIEGVYVPALFDVSYVNGRPVSIQGPGGTKNVRRRIERDLDSLPFPTGVVVPVIRAVHDRYAVEIARGCLQGCRFCQAGFIYRPYRERNISKVLELLEEGLEQTGYGECSFLSLSAGDYSQVSRLLDVAVERNLSSMVSVSLPSLRVASLTEGMIDRIKAIRKTGFTIAPEAGTQRLRDVINKKIDEDEILSTVENIFKAGWHLVKLYFMIGLPTERPEDMEGLIDIVMKVWKTARNVSRKNEVTASISSFVPKPHTPFQWCPMASIEEIQGKQDYLKRRLSRRGLRVKWHDARLSFWEGVLSRGGRPLGEFLLRLSEAGAYLDGWTDQFSDATWREVASGFDPDVLFSGLEAWESEALFPWDVVDTGIHKTYLWEEYQKALRAGVSPPCPEGPCRKCGVCDPSGGVSVRRSRSEGTQLEVLGGRGRTPGQAPRSFLRVTFAKVGNARYLGHLDMVRAILMAARRCRLPMAYSQGFHPAPKVRFSSPIPLGMESLCEVAEFTLVRFVDPIEIRRRMNRFLPRGIRVREAAVASLKSTWGFDKLEVQNYVCLFRVLGPREAESIVKSVQQIRDGEMDAFAYSVKEGKISLLLAKHLAIESVKVTPRWIKMKVRIEKLPRGVRPMPLMWRLFGLKAEDISKMRMIKVGFNQNPTGTP